MEDEEMDKSTAPSRGLDRKEHFDEGRTLASWRGTHLVEIDRRREASRRACRGRHRDVESP